MKYALHGAVVLIICLEKDGFHYDPAAFGYVWAVINCYFIDYAGS